MYLRRLIYSEVGKYVMSILLGLGLATLFRRVCNDRSCLVFHAPHINKIKGQIFDFDGKKYLLFIIGLYSKYTLFIQS